MNPFIVCLSLAGYQTMANSVVKLASMATPVLAVFKEWGGWALRTSSQGTQVSFDHALAGLCVAASIYLITHDCECRRR